jgi:hypothetical protein
VFDVSRRQTTESQNIIQHLQMHSGERLLAGELKVAAHHQVDDGTRLLPNFGQLRVAAPQ